MGKTQVVPKVKKTIPKMELVVAVNSVRLTTKVEQSLKMSIKEVKYFMDLSRILGMLQMELGR
jgi:hypothetical protein